MSEIDLDSQITAVKDQMSCDLSGEAVILAFHNGVYYTLNPVGSRIWNLIQEPIHIKEILRKILEEFDVDDIQCKTELLTLLQGLQQEGLITVKNDS